MNNWDQKLTEKQKQDAEEYDKQQNAFTPVRASSDPLFTEVA